MTRTYERVAVLKGGPSSEREVSLRSGAAVAAGVRAAGDTVDEIDVRGPELDLPPGIEAVFIALHGAFGEDGQVQALLEQRRIPYTGSHAGPSQTSFDKRMSKRCFVEAGIPTPAYELLKAGQPRRLPLPVVIKPPCQGSTIGVHRIRTDAEWAPALQDALRYGDEALVEAFIPGRELTVGIVGEDALPVIEVIAPNGWYDYDAKYGPNRKTEYRTPAPLAPAVAQRCQRLALDVFHALRCRGMARVDFRMAPDGGLYVLELNNIPGFTETSLLPKAAQAAGLGFPELCNRIMEMACLP